MDKTKRKTMNMHAIIDKVMDITLLQLQRQNSEHCTQKPAQTAAGESLGYFMKRTVPVTD